jgi:hypothetical protein
MIDCSRGDPYENLGCGGGDENKALLFAKKVAI